MQARGYVDANQAQDELLEPACAHHSAAFVSRDQSDLWPIPLPWCYRTTLGENHRTLFSERLSSGDEASLSGLAGCLFPRNRVEAPHEAPSSAGVDPTHKLDASTYLWLDIVRACKLATSSKFPCISNLPLKLFEIGSPDVWVPAVDSDVCDEMPIGKAAGLALGLADVESVLVKDSLDEIGNSGCRGIQVVWARNGDIVYESCVG